MIGMNYEICQETFTEDLNIHYVAIEFILLAINIQSNAAMSWCVTQASWETLTAEIMKIFFFFVQEYSNPTHIYVETRNVKMI